MDNALGTALAPIPQSKKAAARIAIVDLKDGSQTILSECFRQFGIEAVLVTGNAAERLRKEKFEACVVKLGPGAQAVMEAARTSASNSRMVIYGLGGSAQEAMRYSKYGINAMIQEPVERSAVLKLVRATNMLVLHEFRRYVRIPVMTEVTVQVSEGRKFNATSIEVSSGGMSIKSAEAVNPGQSVEVSFALLTLPRLWVRASVTWKKPKHSFGVRFDNTDERRRRLKEWIDAYLEN
ncbi:MAG TPA: PilZ domain-containing protein [Terriglobales bacterium]|nr:PilZ domain-containing protein [Terriglobales bacterium]